MYLSVKGWDCWATRDLMEMQPCIREKKNSFHGCSGTRNMDFVQSEWIVGTEYHDSQKFACMFYICICNYIDFYIRITKNLILFILTYICMITTWFFSFSHTFAWFQIWIFTNVSTSSHCSNCLEDSCSNLIVYVKIQVTCLILRKNQVKSWKLRKNQVASWILPKNQVETWIRE